MFPPEVYQRRRNRLRMHMKDGIAIFPANRLSPMNYPENPFHYRQDSNFLYFFGLDQPGINGVIDFESGREILFGDDLSMDDIIWMGNQPDMQSLAEKAAVGEVLSSGRLREYISEAYRKGSKIHYLPAYRDDTALEMADLFSIPLIQVKQEASEELIRGVAVLRSVKEDLEIREIEKAIDITREMHITAMQMAHPGILEREIAGRIEGIALGQGSGVSFPIILSTDGQILHNHSHENLLEKGRMLVTDAGAETQLHYAGDITRTVPVGGQFSERQKEVYEIVLEAEMSSINRIKPGVPYKEIHLEAARVIASGLKELGLMKGDVEEAVNQGAHALFFPHGLGHHMGLDVHDMEGLGEDYVGYDDEIQRSTQFGMASLRLGKRLQKGFVLTVEPGIYFIPALIDQWKSEAKHTGFINYDRVEKFKDFGGIRIEDDVLVNESGARVLGQSIPKTVHEIEDIMKP